MTRITVIAIELLLLSGLFAGSAGLVSIGIRALSWALSGDCSA